MKKIILAGLVGGVVMFLWGYVAHGLLHVGENAIQSVDAGREDAALAGLKTNLGESGLYYLPWMDPSADHDDAEVASYGDRHERGPVALIVYQKDGAAIMAPSTLAKEALSNILAALIVACMSGMMTGSYLKRAMAIAGFGAVGWLSISASDMIWFHFPIETFVGEGIEQIAGWLIVGFVVAKIVPAAQS